MCCRLWVIQTMLQIDVIWNKWNYHPSKPLLTFQREYRLNEIGSLEILYPYIYIFLLSNVYHFKMNVISETSDLAQTIDSVSISQENINNKLGIWLIKYSKLISIHTNLCICIKRQLLSLTSQWNGNSPLILSHDKIVLSDCK